MATLAGRFSGGTRGEGVRALRETGGDEGEEGATPLLIRDRGGVDIGETLAKMLFLLRILGSSTWGAYDARWGWRGCGSSVKTAGAGHSTGPAGQPKEGRGSGFRDSAAKETTEPPCEVAQPKIPNSFPKAVGGLTVETTPPLQGGGVGSGGPTTGREVEGGVGGTEHRSRRLCAGRSGDGTKQTFVVDLGVCEVVVSGV